jgi:hypothetical protein
VTKAKSGRKLHMVCCNDVLVLIDERMLYRSPVPLQNMTVEKEKGRDETGFAVVIPYARRADTIRFRAPSARERDDWIVTLTKAKHACVAARASAGELGGGGAAGPTITRVAASAPRHLRYPSHASYASHASHASHASRSSDGMHPRVHSGYSNASAGSHQRGAGLAADDDDIEWQNDWTARPSQP